MKYFSFVVLVVTLGVSFGKYLLVDLDQEQQAGRISTPEPVANEPGYSLINDKGICVHVSGKDPYQCFRNDVSSQSLCEDHCTSWNSCIGYDGLFGHLAKKTKCNLFISERSCPSGFKPYNGMIGQWQHDWPIAASMNDLKADPLGFRGSQDWVCYGKI